MLDNSSAFGLSDGHVNGGMGLHGSSTQITNRNAAPESYMNMSSFGSSPRPLQQQFNQLPTQRIPSMLAYASYLVLPYHRDFCHKLDVMFAKCKSKASDGLLIT